jgi:hypothetical protein
MIKFDQHSTKRGVLLFSGAVASLVFAWFGHDASAVMPIFLGLAGGHMMLTDDEQQK